MQAGPNVVFLVWCVLNLCEPQILGIDIFITVSFREFNLIIIGYKHSSMIAKSYKTPNMLRSNTLVLIQTFIFICDCVIKNNMILFPAPSVDYLLCFLEEFYGLFRQVASADVIFQERTHLMDWPN